MSAPVNNQAGFSLTEVLLAMVLMVMVVTALGGYHRALASGFASASQWRQLWRCAWQQAQPTPPPLPPVGGSSGCRQLQRDVSASMLPSSRQWAGRGK